MDEATLKRLQDLLGEEDVWEEPQPAGQLVGGNNQPKSPDKWNDGWDDGGDVWNEQNLPESPDNEPGGALLSGNPVPQHIVPLDEGINSTNQHISPVGGGSPSFEQGGGSISPDPYYESDGVTYQQPKPIGGRRRRQGGRETVASQFPTRSSLVSMEVLKNTQFDDYRLEMGEAASKDLTFCPWDMVVNYPTHFIGNTNRDRCAPFFHQEELLSNYTWDFFYIRNPRHQIGSAIYFVPTEQFEHLLAVVNGSMGTALCIPLGHNAERFSITFGELKTPRPRFLGRVSSGADYLDLRRRTPELDPRDDLDNVTSVAGQLFIEKLDKIAKTPSRKKAAKSAANRRKRMRTRLAWGRTIKRVQRYLGLRKANDLSTEVQEILDGDQSLVLKKLDLSRATPWEPEKDVVFVAVDVEWFEFDNSLVTEVGLAILDTRLTEGVAPGENLQNWFGLIKARHLRITENASAVNRVHVRGCETSFNFGKSEFIDLKDIVKLITAALQPKSEGKSTEQGQQSTDSIERHVVLVGHDFDSDIRALGTLGYNAYGNKQLVEVVDTQGIYQYHRRSTSPRSLGVVLGDLDIRHTHLHNGGNDAVYTLQAMIGIAVKHRQARLAFELALSAKPKMAGFEATNEDDGGWSSGGEFSDGGNPDPIISQELEDILDPREEQWTHTLGPW